MALTTSINDQLRKRFRDDGVVFLQAALAREDLAMAEEAFNWSLAHPGAGASKFDSKDPSAVFYQDLANPNCIASYLPMLERSPATDVASMLWAAPDVWFMYEQVFLKQGGESRRTPWHQDSSYLPIEGERLAVVWITFERVAKENALEFVRGSHRGPLYDGSRFDPNDDTAPIYGNGSLPRLPNIEGDRSKWDIVSWAVEPGDILVFHPRMLHGGAPTHPGQRRRTLSLRFFGDDVVYAPRIAAQVAGNQVANDDADAPRSVFAKLPRLLKPGDPFRHPDFPKLRPR